MAELTKEERQKLIDLCKQKVASNGIAALTTIFIILTFMEQKKDNSREELKEIKQSMQDLSRTMQSIQLSLVALADSIRSENADTTLVRVLK